MVRPARKEVRQAEGGSMIEAIAGAAAALVAVVGLAGMQPITMAGIAVIAVGAALLVGGGTVVKRYSRLVNAEEEAERPEIAGGAGVEAILALAGMVLGLLALLGMSPLPLLSVAVIVLGAGLLLHSAAMSRLERSSRVSTAERAQKVSHEAVYVAGGTDVLIGMGTIVLGILALAGFNTLMLVLVAMLALGISILLSGSVLAARVFSTVRHQT